MIRPEITVFPADKPGNYKIGWVVKESIGLVVINTPCLEKITELQHNGKRRFSAEERAMMTSQVSD